MASTSGTSAGKLNLLFIRHGETQDNIDKMLQGHRDTSLTEKGLQEAQVLGKKLQGQQIDMIYHSPLVRIVQTIEPILKDQPNIPTQADADLKGQMLGVLEGGSYDMVDFDNPRSADDKEGVERFDDFVKRLLRATARIVGAEAPKVGDKDRNVIVATHGVAITSIFKALEDNPQCDGFLPKMAVRGPDAYEVWCTDSDDVAIVVLSKPAELPMKDGRLDWTSISGQPFLIEYWGKKEKAQ